MPKFLAESTWPEFAMVKRMSVLATTTVLRGGQNRAMKSHAMCFDASAGPLATHLPKQLNDTYIYKVIFAGHMTNEQRILCQKRHIIRHKQVKKINIYNLRYINLIYLHIEYRYAPY